MTTVVEIIIGIIVPAAVVLFAIWEVRRRHRALLRATDGRLRQDGLMPRRDCRVPALRSSFAGFRFRRR